MPVRTTFLIRRLVAAVAAFSTCAVAFAQRGNQAIDEDYTADIRRFTTTDAFSTKHVDYLPASETVPTVKDVLGHIAGADDVLSYSHEIYRYMRAVDEASDRVKVFSMGETEEGREMILVVISDAVTLENLDLYKEVSGFLADPRKIPDEDRARRLINESKFMYWATGAMHSGETGPPEMLMELTYRLAVDESDFVRAIRDNMIVMLTPVLDVDGRDKRVDLFKMSQADLEGIRTPSLIYWGKYVQHDNNRDGMGLGLKLSQHVMETYLDYRPQVIHDLHESATHLYISTGTGPYNAWVDPILVNEWHLLAYHEINEMTKEGVPGVWTHDFYDGWAPNYMFYAANGHNSIGRFYETQSALGGTAGGSESRPWFRTNPPLRNVRWSIRNNNNIMMSAIMIGMNGIAKNKNNFMESFYRKGKRSIAKARTEGPAAYVFPASDPRPAQQARLLELLQMQGIEVHRASADFTVGEAEYGAGSYVVRMDQPYSRMADMLLDTGYYNVSDPRPYDDTGWTLGPLFNAETVRVEDAAALDAAMTLVEGRVKPPGGVQNLDTANPSVFLVDANADLNLVTFRYKLADVAMEAAESGFEAGGRSFNPGTFIISASGDAAGRIRQTATDLGVTVYGVGSAPEVATHPVSAPRVAIMHGWGSTQNEGWVRMAFDEMELPHDYISDQDARGEGLNLREKYDVIVLGSGFSTNFNEDPTEGNRIPWKAIPDLAPNIGRQDETDDMRLGMGPHGLDNIKRFVSEGGLLIALADSSSFAINNEMSGGLETAGAGGLQARGSVFYAKVHDPASPIAYGYGEYLGVPFRGSPLFDGGLGNGFTNGTPQQIASLNSGTARPTGRGNVFEEDIVQGRPRNLGQETLQGGGGGRGGRAGRGGGRVGRAGERGGRGGERGAQAARAGRGGRGGGGRGGERGGRGGRGGGGGGEPVDYTMPERDIEARTIVRISQDAEKFHVAGMIAGGERLAGTSAVVDAPFGEGHVVMFSINPMWRHSTMGTWSLVTNAILHYDRLDAGSNKN